MSIGLQKAKELDADILCGTDPDADRIGIGIKDTKGNWVLMNGNQTAVLAFNYMIESRKEKGATRESAAPLPSRLNEMKFNTPVRPGTSCRKL